MKHVFSSVLLLLCLQVPARRILVHSPDGAVAALEKARPGDSILLADGIYKDAVLRFRTAGTQLAPVVFMAEEPGRVFFEGNSRLAFAGEHVIIHGFVWRNGGRDLGRETVIDFRAGSGDVARHSVLEYCVIDGYNLADKNADNKWVGLHGQDNAVRHCLFRAKDNLGATLTVWLKEGEEARHTIEYNHFQQRINGPAADNGLESMRIGDSKTSMTSARCRVRFNLFEDCDGEIEIISNKSCHNLYEGNTFINNDGGLTLRHGNACTVTGNFFFGGTKRRSYGIRVIGEDHVVSGNYLFGLLGGPADDFRAPITLVNGQENSPLNGYFQVKNAVIRENVLVNCNGPAIRIGAGKRKEAVLPPVQVLIEGNIVFTTQAVEGASLMAWHPLVSDASVQVTNNRYAGSWMKQRGWQEVKKDLLHQQGNLWWPAGRSLPLVGPVSAAETGPRWYQ
jgi:poly(beta-D-mannuronate) lyase